MYSSKPLSPIEVATSQEAPDEVIQAINRLLLAAACYQPDDTVTADFTEQDLLTAIAAQLGSSPAIVQNHDWLPLVYRFRASGWEIHLTHSEGVATYHFRGKV